MTTEYIQVKKYLIRGDMEAQGMSNFGNLTIEVFRFRLEPCVLQWGILFTSSSLFYSYSHSFDYEPQVWVGRGFGTWRLIKYSVALALRHTKYLGLGAGASEYFMNHQVTCCPWAKLTADEEVTGKTSSVARAPPQVPLS